MEGVEYIKYSASPKFGGGGVEGNGYMVEVVMVVGVVGVDR